MNKGQLVIDLKNMIGPGPEVDDGGLTTWLNDAYLYVCDQISQANPDFFTKAETASMVTGQTEYSLPADFERALMVELELSGTWRRAMPLPGIGSLPISENTSGLTYNPGDPVYYIYGGNIGFRPLTFATGDTIKLWYVYTPTELSADTDTPAFPAKYHHLLKYGAYATYLDEDDQHAAAEAMRNRFEQRIQNMLESMDANQVDEPKSVEVTHNYDLYVDQDQYV